jgi:predicted amidohydrolase YtcJ
MFWPLLKVSDHSRIAFVHTAICLGRTHYFYAFFPIMRHYLALFCMTVFSVGCSTKKHADFMLHHARIYTVDSAFSIAEALAVKDGKLVAIGSNRELMNTYDADSSFDVQGQAVYPGFIDAHAHFVGYGRSLFEVNLYGCRNWAEVIQRVQDFAKDHPGIAWIRGRGWDQNAWPGQAFPDNAALNTLFPNTPVLLQRVDGHAAIANEKALALAGIKSGQTLAGGSIESKGGRLTGLLIDNAVDLVTRVIPKPAYSDYEQWLTKAQQNCFAQGLTTITDCGLMYQEVDAIKTLQEQGKLLMRLYVMLSDDTANYRRYLSKGPYKTDRLFVKGIKVYADGALGSRGACLLAPYSDKPAWHGFLLSPESHFDSIARMLINTEFQMCTHAIGDSGNRVVLQIYNRYLKGKNDKRWRIEHAQVVAPEDFKLFGQSSVVPSVQPTHATSDMYWAGDRLGAQRMGGAYAYRQLLQQNGWLPLGTDFPVEDISPFKTFYAAVVRKDAKGYPPQAFQKEAALSREQTLRGMTIWAAKAGFMETEVGSLEKGKKADFIILSQDLMELPDTALLSARVSRTYIGGKRVY